MQFDTPPKCGHLLVHLRPLLATDLAAWSAYLSQPLVQQHTSWARTSPEDLAHSVWTPETRAPNKALRLAIARRTDDELIGTAGFHTVSDENRSAEIAYDFAPEVWGQGIASHVCALLVAWAHAHCRVVRVQATVLDTNVRSQRVVERCGFVREGMLRSYRMVRGRPGDFHMYSHLDAPPG